jgi:hypothetical protein
VVVKVSPVSEMRFLRQQRKRRKRKINNSGINKRTEDMTQLDSSYVNN